jgi:hemerythrin-like domain-containing protein
MAHRSPIDELRFEHRLLSVHLADLETMLREVTSDEAWERVGLEVCRRLDAFLAALAVHFRKEEDGLFPDVRAMVAEDPTAFDIVGRFFAEEADEDLGAHRVLAARAADMVSTLDEAQRAASLGAVRLQQLLDLTESEKDLMTRHAGKEEQVVFPMIARSLSHEQLTRIGTRLAAFGGTTAAPGETAAGRTTPESTPSHG